MQLSSLFSNSLPHLLPSRLSTALCIFLVTHLAIFILLAVAPWIVAYIILPLLIVAAFSFTLIIIGYLWFLQQHESPATPQTSLLDLELGDNTYSQAETSKVAVGMDTSWRTYCYVYWLC